MDTEKIDLIKATLGNIPDKDRFYVYMLCEGRTPFYIGKGQGDRVYQHEFDEDAKQAEIIESLNEIDSSINNEIIKSKDSELILELEKKRERLKTEIKDDISAKYKKIEDLKRKNIQINKVIVKWGLTENEAFMVESALMNMYFYMNESDIHEHKVLTNIVNGHMSSREKINISHNTKARTVEDFLKECAVEDTLITNIYNYCVMFVNISKTYPDCKDLDISEQQKAIYDCSRAAWKIGPNRIEKIDYVFSLYNSQVVGIYKVNRDSWYRRKDIDKKYNFPKYPLGIREREWKYTSALNKIDNKKDAEKFCKNTDGFSIKELNEVVGSDFNEWKNRYCFTAIFEPLPKEISNFLNKLLYFPQPNGKRRKIGQNDTYNFNILSKNGEVSYKIKKEYN